MNPKLKHFTSPLKLNIIDEKSQKLIEVNQGNALYEISISKKNLCEIMIAIFPFSREIKS